MKFKLRPYRTEDFEALYQIDQLCYEPEIAYSRRDLREYMRFPGAECIVSETEHAEIAGFCLAAHEDQLGYIITMDVLSAYRRLGIAAELLQRIEQTLALKGVQEVWLETATDNNPAIAFWGKHGYRKQGVRKNYYPGGRDAYTMCKEMNPSTRRAPAGKRSSRTS